MKHAICNTFYGTWINFQKSGKVKLRYDKVLGSSLYSRSLFRGASIPVFCQVRSEKALHRALEVQNYFGPVYFFSGFGAQDAHVTSYGPSTKRGRGGGGVETLLRIVCIAAGQNPEKHVLYFCYVYTYFDYLLITGLHQLFLCVHLIVFLNQDK